MGGSGMRSLAELLRQAGCVVTGSEADGSRAADLRRSGFAVGTNDAAERVGPDVRWVVRSVAVDAQHPECQRARELGISLDTYPQAIGRLFQRRTGVAVAGTHGKSTTSAMVAALLEAGGCDPTVVVGASAAGRGGLGRWGTGPIVAEACEYRRSFLSIHPAIAVLTGIEPDHFDCYHGASDLEEAFASFVAGVHRGGTVVVRRDCAASQRVVRKAATARIETFSVERPADWSATLLGCKDGRYRFRVAHRAVHLADIELAVPGRHQVQNALAAVAVAAEFGVPARVVRTTLERFGGLERRLQHVANVAGRVLVDDYAHHPTAIAAGLATLREAHRGRICCVFQPHQLSRTRGLLDRLACSLKNADKVWITEVYRAREPITGRTHQQARNLAKLLADRVNRLGGNADVAWSHSTIVERLAAETATGDVVVTMGAGNIKEVCDGFVDRLRGNCAA